jgi:predicted RNase H-like nuclease (RuvC/YqgF family)
LLLELKEENIKLKDENAKFRRDFDKVQKKSNEYYTENLKHQNHIDKLTQTIDELKIENAELKTENAELKRRITQLETENKELKRRVTQLEDVEKNNRDNGYVKNLTFAIRDLNAYFGLEKHLDAESKYYLKMSRQHRNEQGHLIMDDETENVANYKISVILRHLTKLDPAQKKKLEGKIGKHTVSKVVEYCKHETTWDESQIPEYEKTYVEKWFYD